MAYTTTSIHLDDGIAMTAHVAVRKTSDGEGLYPAVTLGLGKVHLVIFPTAAGLDAQVARFADLLREVADSLTQSLPLIVAEDQPASLDVLSVTKRPTAP